MQLQSGGLHYEAREATEDMYGSIDAAVHKLERQIHDGKGLAGAKRRRDTDLRHSEAEAEALAMAASDR